MASGSKPTLKSLAAELGLSITTVSRALAGYQDVSPSTRRQVRSAAKRAGYVPDINARRLVSGRTDAVGIVLPFPVDELLDPYVNDPFINELIRHLAHALQRSLDLDLIVGYAHRDQDLLEVYRRFIQGRRVDAFCIPRTQARDLRVEYLLGLEVPFVCHGRTDYADRHAWVDTDAKRGFANATRHFLALGHRCVALLNMPTRYFTAGLRAEGYSEAIRAAGLKPLIENCELRMHSGYRAAESLLRSPEPPTALLCATDILAVGAMRAVRELGRVPGKDVSVIGADNLPLARLLEPELASMTYSYQRISDVMITMLEQQLSAGKILALHQLTDFQLIERGSLGPYPPV